MSDKNGEKKDRHRTPFKKLGNIIIPLTILGFLFFALFYVIHFYSKYFSKNILPKGYFSIIEAIFITVFGILAIKIIQKSSYKILSGYVSEDKAGFLRFLLSFTAYFILVLFIFTTLGIDISNILLGATFIGVIFGIAAQSFLSNLLAGFIILLGKPFKIGDRITIVTWQYGLLMSTYQHEAAKPGYTGVIKDINMLFTTILEDSGFTMKAPNNVLMQALITNYDNTKRRLVRVRFELDKEIDFESFKNELYDYLTLSGNYRSIPENDSKIVSTLIEKNPPPIIRVVDVSITSYFVAVEVYSPQIYDDPVRDIILSFVLKLKRRMKNGN
ncbi:MAG: mechanosensitive ion channel family protein [Candidatus Acidulodesulfobacterium sp.]